MEEAGIEFTQRSGDAWRAKCFLHPDKTPSLVVSVRKGLFNCFSTGCEARGDVICFYEQFNSVDRHAAVRALADKIGIAQEDEKEDAHSKIQQVMGRVTEACTLEFLDSKRARDYVYGRGVSEDVAIGFGIGYCPSVKWLRSIIGSASAELVRSMEFDSYKYEDVMVLPCVHPTTGHIAHYVRPFRTSSSKYMGPSTTNPSRWAGMLFGLQVARKHARESGGLTLVEGQFDCLVMHSFGFRNTVCVLGSHPSQDQYARLRELHIGRATILFDGDRAGAEGAAQVVLSAPSELRVSVAHLPGICDPDTYLMQEGSRSLKLLLGAAVSAIDYIIGRRKGELLSGDSHQVADGLRGVLDDLSKLAGEGFTAGVLALSRLLKVPADSLYDLVRESKPDAKAVVESERQVLAMSLKDPSHVYTLDGLPEEAWFLVKHRKIFQTLKELVSNGAKKIDAALIQNRIQDQSIANGAISGLFALEASNFEYHMAQVREAYIRRRLIWCADKLRREAQNTSRGVGEVVSDHLHGISQNASPTSRSEFTAPEVVEDAMQFIQERMADPGTLPGIDLGPKWANVTKALLGLQPNRMYLVGAGPKVGKTSLALNWASVVAIERKMPVLWINLEMSQRDLTMRLFSILSGLSSLRVQSGALDTKEKAILDLHAAEIYSSPLHILNAFGMTVQEIISVMRKYIFTHAVRLIFIDYIQLLNVADGGRMDYWERHAQISTALKQAINADLGVPVVALSQLGRPASTEGSSSGSFIGGSYKYVQDCDTFMGLRVRSDKELEDGLGGNLVLNIEYNRHGPQDVYARVHFNKDNLRLEEIL